MADCTPYQITIEWDVPDECYNVKYCERMAGFAVYMISDDGSLSHKPFEGADCQGLGGAMHIATVRPDTSFTYRSPCDASHPKSRQHTVLTPLLPGRHRQSDRSRD